MSCFLWIIQIKFVTKTQSLINRLEYGLYGRILELVFKNQQNKYEMNGKKTPNIQSFNIPIVYFQFSYIPIFLFPKNSIKVFMLSENFGYPKLGIKKLPWMKKTTASRQHY